MTARHHRHVSHTRRALIAVTGVAVIGGGAAYAFWTTTGTGSGPATSSTVAAVTVVPTTTPSNVNPGLAAQTLSGTFNNPNSGPAYITNVVASIAAVVPSAGATGTPCVTSDYSIAAPTMGVSQDVAAGTGKGTWSGATIVFVNKPTNQDGCKGASVTISYSAN